MPETKPLEKPTLNKRLRSWARNLKNDVVTLYFALRHPRTPLYAKIFAGMVVGYALSPIDLIPDFVPVLGYLDDVILLPFGIMLALKIIPADVMCECREAAMKTPLKVKPKSWVGASFIVALWIAVLYGLYCLVRR